MMSHLLLFILSAGFCSAIPRDSRISQRGADSKDLQGLRDGLNFKFTASDTPQPFTIDVDADFVAKTKQKSALFRPTRNIEGVGWSNGPPTSDINDLQQYFLQHYSWNDVQKQLNDICGCTVHDHSLWWTKLYRTRLSALRASEV